MKTKIIPGTTRLIIPAKDMVKGQIGKVNAAQDELYVVCQDSSEYKLPIGFLKIWPKSNCFETSATIPDTWIVELLPEGTVLNITF